MEIRALQPIQILDSAYPNQKSAQFKNKKQFQISNKKYTTTTTALHDLDNINSITNPSAPQL